MKKLLIIALFFVGCVFGQTNWYNYKMGMDFGGFIPDGNGYILSMYWFDKTKNVNPLCGIMLYTGAGDGSGKYEDYTSVFGTVNNFDDRNDGLISIGDISGLASVGRIIIKKQEFMFHYGFAFSDKSYYQALYDRSEILGDNGYYYIDSNEPNDKESGLIYGIKYNYHFPDDFKDGFIGVGLHFNTLSDVPQVLIRMDVGFILGM